MKNALLIDDCIDFREIFSLQLLERDFAVWEASSTEEAFQILEVEEESFDVIFCDLHLPFTLGDRCHDYLYTEEVGIRTIEELQWVYPDLPIVAISAAPEIDILKLQTRVERIRALSKPIYSDALDEVLTSIQLADSYTPDVSFSVPNGSRFSMQ